MFASNTSAANGAATYIEDVFSTYLYTGNASTLAINNGIDLTTYGGMVWVKGRSNTNRFNVLNDTVRGPRNALYSNTTSANNGGNPQAPSGYDLDSFGSSGFTLGPNYYSPVNYNNETFVSWTFRKQPKFFDVVTYTGNGALATRYISHSLGSVPGTIIVKRTDTTSDWIVIHRGTTFPLILNSTAAASSTNRNNGYPDLTYTDATQFAVSDGASGVSAVNASGGQYVAYLFAHNAGGFGLTGTDNVISCGSYAGNGGTQTVSLGYEPQWILIKDITTSTQNWGIYDVMRGMPVPSADGVRLAANTSAAELAVGTASFPYPTATGFAINGGGAGINQSGATYIYIAIRRGPMKTPTSGTSVFMPIATSAAANTVLTTGFRVDMLLEAYRAGTWGGNSNIGDRLRGVSTLPNSDYTNVLVTSSTNAEVQNTYNASKNWSNTGLSVGGGVGGSSSIFYNFQRAPGFFDEVCYTGTGSATTVTHNLGVAPELMIVKRRNSSTYGDWYVYAASQGATKFLLLNLTDAVATNSGPWNNTSPTSSVFTAGSDLSINSTATYVAYLFASCPGVSKCGSYTGTGTTQQINCGFTGGARFVLIKRTDSTGDWYVWDSARGIVAGNDPYLLLNSTAAEVTSTDYIDTYSAGFEISSTAPAAINASGGSFVYLAIA